MNDLAVGAKYSLHGNLLLTGNVQFKLDVRNLTIPNAVYGNQEGQSLPGFYCRKVWADFLAPLS